jgi:DNA-binding PadR family transcriptional regulator
MSVRHAMLALLSEGPKYGLQLREEFEARTGEVWPLNVGQVYTTLQRLERDGLIASENDDGDTEGPQKAYRITETGESELATWLRTPPDLSSPPRDELVMKVLIALRVPGASVRDVIQAHRRYLVELMQQWTRIKEDAAEDDLSTQLAVDAELFRLDSVVRWLDAAEARVRRAAHEHKPNEHEPNEREPKGATASGLRSEAVYAERRGNLPSLSARRRARGVER